MVCVFVCTKSQRVVLILALFHLLYIPLSQLQCDSVQEGAHRVTPAKQAFASTHTHCHSGLDPLRKNYDWFRNRRANQMARAGFII